MTRTKLIFTGILFATVGLTGCANWSHQEKGTAAGAVVGGVGRGAVDQGGQIDRSMT